jgi:hypothetical protein
MWWRMDKKENSEGIEWYGVIYIYINLTTLYFHKSDLACLNVEEVLSTVEYG